MNWATIRPALLAVVQASAGLTAPGAVAWKGSKEAAGMRPLVVANLSITSVSGVGNDEERAEYTPGVPPSRTITISGQRQIRVTVRLETQSQADASIALVYADRLRARILRQSNADALAAAGLALADIGATTVIDNVVVQGRTLSVAVVELTINAAENDRDDTVGAGNWIEDASGLSNFTNPDGTESPVKADFEVNT